MPSAVGCGGLRRGRWRCRAVSWADGGAGPFHGPKSRCVLTVGNRDNPPGAPYLAREAPSRRFRFFFVFLLLFFILC